MDALEYAEARGSQTLEVLRKAYDDLHDRAYKLATVLVAGGGAAAAYSLGKFSLDVAPVSWAPIAALALSWFGTAGVLVWSGATSKDLSPGVGAGVLIDYFDDRLADGDGDKGVALEVTRRAEIKLAQQRVEVYQRACTARAVAVDLAYRMTASATPIVPFVVAAYCLWVVG